MFRQYPKKDRVMMVMKGTVEILDLLDDLGVRQVTLKSEKNHDGCYMVHFKADYPTYQMVLKLAKRLNDHVCEF